MQFYKNHFTDKNFIISFSSGLIFLVASLVIQFFISGYVTRAGSGSVTDIILSNIRLYDVSAIFVWGTVIFTIFSLVEGAIHINYMPFAMKSVAVFTLLRSIFVSLTHISPFPNHI